MKAITIIVSDVAIDDEGNSYAVTNVIQANYEGSLKDLLEMLDAHNKPGAFVGFVRS